MTCNHPTCDCSGSSVQRSGRGYCSESCADGAEVSAADGGGCGCGHVGCGATMKLAPAANLRQGDHGQDDGDRAGHGLTGDGLVGDARQRRLESPGRGGQEEHRSASDEDAAGRAMKPGAARPRGLDAPGPAEPARHANPAPAEDRASVRRNNAGTARRSIQAPDARNRGV